MRLNRDCADGIARRGCTGMHWSRGDARSLSGQAPAAHPGKGARPAVLHARAREPGAVPGLHAPCRDVQNGHPALHPYSRVRAAFSSPGGPGGHLQGAAGKRASPACVDYVQTLIQSTRSRGNDWGLEKGEMLIQPAQCIPSVPAPRAFPAYPGYPTRLHFCSLAGRRVSWPGG